MPRVVSVCHKSDCQQLHLFGGVSVIFELATFPGSVYFPGTRPGAHPGTRPGARPSGRPGHGRASGTGECPSVGAGAIGAAPIFAGSVVYLTPAFSLF